MAQTKQKQQQQPDLKDPKETEPKPPFGKQAQSMPGEESQMRPRPDFGEQSYKGSGKLAGRAALITGADSGIGRAVALAYAREGADILISYLNEDQDAAETRRVIEESGRKGVTVPGDISDERHCQQLVERAMNEFGHLDILVNNAAYQMTYKSLDQITSEDFDKTFRTNVYAMFYLVKAAVPHMKPGSAIINTSSIQAFQPKSILLPYAATKGAIANFTEALAQMLAEKGIRVNAVAPGPIWTPLIPASMPEESVSEFGANTPLGRAGQPAEVAPIYVLLASPEASYITGQIYGVTGGKPL